MAILPVQPDPKEGAAEEELLQVEGAPVALQNHLRATNGS